MTDEPKHDEPKRWVTIERSQLVVGDVVRMSEFGAFTVTGISGGFARFEGRDVAGINVCAHWASHPIQVLRAVDFEELLKTITQDNILGLARLGSIAVDHAIDGRYCLTCDTVTNEHDEGCPVGQWLDANPDYRKDDR